MSLIEDMMTDCVLMDKVTESDGQGGKTTTWKAGATIKVAIVCDTSLAARVAEKDGVTNTYTLTTTKENALDFHDVIKRVSDGAIFRVTSMPEKQSPSVSTLNMAQVSAESWELTT